MKINAGLFSLALAGFSTFAAAQPHAKHARGIHARHARALKEREVVYETVTTTITANFYKGHGHTPTPNPVSPSEKGYGSKDTPSPVPSPKGSSKGVDYGSGLDKDFLDGQLDCDHFPSEYGAIPLKWVTKGGWSGIQVGGGNGDEKGICVESALCSYACPPGYTKSQWPEFQPASGESHGGLECKNGKLWLTRPSYKKLCQPGVGGVTVKNEMSETVSICRTDYPGSEAMVIPLACSPGSESELTVPDAGNSYVWKGLATSAQFYVNPAGIDIEDGCKWGKEGGNRGNWAPIIFGSSKKDGFIWLSIAQNQLNSSPAGYNIEIIGGESKCSYVGGVFTGGGDGCTVAVKPGKTAYYRLFK